MNTNNIALRSFQSELSHISAFQLFIRGAYLTKLLFVIMFFYHIYRYVKHFEEALIISKKQINKWYLNVVDYAIIILYQTKFYKLNNTLLFIFSTISGLLSFYFIYLEHGNKKNFSTNIYTDIFVVLSLTLIMIFEKDNRIRFFCIRDIIYHLNEFIFFY